MKIRLGKPALNNFKAYGWQKWKTWTGGFEVKNYAEKLSDSNYINLRKSGQRQSLDCYLLLSHTNYKNIWTFLSIFIPVLHSWCHEFRKYSFNHTLKTCKVLLKKSTCFFKTCKHATFLYSFCKAFMKFHNKAFIQLL